MKDLKDKKRDKSKDKKARYDDKQKIVKGFDEMDKQIKKLTGGKEKELDEATKKRQEKMKA